MKFNTFFKLLTLLFFLVFSSYRAQAQGYGGLNLDIVNNSGYTNADIWLMWQQAASGVNTGNTFSMTDGNSNSVDLTSFQVAGYNTLTTPVQLSANNNYQNGFHINYVNSATLYVGISTNGNPFSSTSAPSPAIDTFMYMPFEATITGAQGDQSDLTAINYSSFPMSLASYSASNNFLQGASWASGTTASGIINTLTNTLGIGSANAVTNSSGNVVRVLGPSNQYNGVSNTTTYSTFQPLLAKLYAQQNDPTAPNFGTAIKLSYSGNGGYTANAIVTTNGAQAGYYGILITNIVANKGTSEADLTNPTLGTPLTGGAVLFPDSSTNQPLAVTIYSGVMHNSTNVGAAPSGYWTGDLTNAYSSLQSTLLASLSASIVTGFAGSTTLFPGTTNQYRALDANQWFNQNSPLAATNPGLFFDQLQPSTGGYYDPYFAQIEQLTSNQIYGSPYADRMSQWTVALNSTKAGPNSLPYSDWTNVASMVLTIGPVAAPEPSTYGLLGLGALSLLMLFYRIKRQS